MKRLLLGLLALLLAQPVLAQTLTPNPDAGVYVPQVATYPAGNAPAGVLGNGVDPDGGVAPAFTLHPEPDESWDIPDYSATTTTVDPNNFCLVGTAPGNCPEKKLRFIIYPSHLAPDDAVRLFCRPGTSHWHEFFGNKTPVACSTRRSLRKHPESMAPGNRLLSTAYWEAEVLFDDAATGNTFAVPAKEHVVYYVKPGNNPGPQVNDLQPLHAFLEFVGGKKPEDPYDCKVKREIDKANGGPGTGCTVTPGRYAYRTDGFLGYSCVTEDGQTRAAVKGGGDYTKSFVLADGTDPWEGRCTDGMIIYPEGNAPECWDGVNTGSITGYDHFRYKIGDNNTGKFICPSKPNGTGWYEVPAFELKSLRKTRGWNDYKRWYLSSDAHMRMVLQSMGINDPVLPGSSFHFDWKNGMHKWLRDYAFKNCLGIGGAPHECNNSVVGPDRQLLMAYPLPPATDNFNVSTLQKIGPTKAVRASMHAAMQ